MWVWVWVFFFCSSKVFVLQDICISGFLFFFFVYLSP